MIEFINILLLAIGGILTVGETVRLAGGRAALGRPATWVGFGLIAAGFAAALWGGGRVDLVHAGQLANRWYGIGMATALVGGVFGMGGGMGLILWPGRRALTGRSFALAPFRRRLRALAAKSVADPAVQAALRELRGELGDGADDLLERRQLTEEIDRLLTPTPDRPRAIPPR